MTKNVQNQNTIIMETEERCIDLLMEGVMTLDKILYGGFSGMTYHDLWRVYRYADAQKLELLLDVGLPIKEAIAKSFIGSEECDRVLVRKVEAMSDEEADELAERIEVLDEVRRILRDEVVTL